MQTKPKPTPAAQQQPHPTTRHYARPIPRRPAAQRVQKVYSLYAVIHAFPQLRTSRGTNK